MFNFSPIPLRVILLIVAAGLLGGFIWFQGYDTANQRWESKEAGRLAVEQQAQIQQHILQRQAEREQASRVAALDAQYQEDLSHAQTEIDKLRRAARTGDLRLYAKPASKPVALGVYDSATASSADDQARCELDSTTADDLISITADGDEAIRQLSALQGYVREVCLSP